MLDSNIYDRHTIKWIDFNRDLSIDLGEWMLYNTQKYYFDIVSEGEVSFTLDQATAGGISDAIATSLD